MTFVQFKPDFLKFGKIGGDRTIPLLETGSLAPQFKELGYVRSIRNHLINIILNLLGSR